MSETTKTILIVGGVAAGAFVLARALAPRTMPRTTASQSDALIGGLFSAGANALVNIFGKSEPTPFYDRGESFEDFTDGLFGDGIFEAFGS